MTLPPIRPVALAGALLLALALPLASASAKPRTGRDVPKEGALYQDGPGGRYLMSGRWYFRPDPGDDGLKQRWQHELSRAAQWQRVEVPYAWNATDKEDGSMVGMTGWFRKEFWVPDNNALMDWIVRFESVNYRTQVWLNGKPIGRNTGAYLPFELRLAGIKRNARNVLIVRVNNIRRPTDFPPAGLSRDGRPTGGWWNYGGILREVYLRKVDRLGFTNVRVRAKLPCRKCNARVEVRTTIRNYSPHVQRARMTGTFGTRRLEFPKAKLKPGTYAVLKDELTIRRPELWSPNNPNLYPVRLQLLSAAGDKKKKKKKKGAKSSSAGALLAEVLASRAPARVATHRKGHRADEYTPAASWALNYGIRSLEVNNEGELNLNGRPLRLRGVGFHEDHPGVGSALNNRHRERIFKEIVDSGAKIMRTHYPIHPQFLELADKAGVFVWSEIPMYAMRTRYLKRLETRLLAAKYLRVNIRENRNHPSILTWSVANELSSRPGPVQGYYIQRTANYAHELDPTRPVSLAVAGYPSVGYQKRYAPLDLIGVNDYFGWYPGPNNQLVDRNGLGPYLDRLRAQYPKKAIMVTEFGAEANREGAVEEKGTYAFQQDFVNYHLDRYDQRPWLAGALYWTLQEFRVRPGWIGGNPKPGPHLSVHQKGVISFDGNFRKPAYSDLQRRFREYKQTP